MKFAFDCENEVLLPFLYDFAQDAGDFLKKTGVLEIRKRQPPEGVTPAEQGKKNLEEMLKVLCKDYPKEVGALSDRMWILEEGEKAPNVFATVARILSSREVIDFFMSLMQLA